MRLHRIPKRTVGYTFYHRSEGKIFVAKNGSFLEKEFLSKEVSGRKVELDEVIVPSLDLESSSSQKTIPVMPTPINEKLMMMIMKLQIKLLLVNVACNFKKIPTIMQDLSRRCIAMRRGQCVHVPS